jgi:glyoxylase-like metal-dependent hydrolase (beta-lactamase superfamily II)
MQLNKITAGAFYLDGAVNLGLVTVAPDRAVLIDTGLDESVGRKVRALLAAQGLRLEAIVITHAHADHCGGAPFLAKATGAKVYAPALEKAVLEAPILEPVYLFGGAYPPDALRSKFFLAPGVRVDGTIELREPGEGGGLAEGRAGATAVAPGLSDFGVEFLPLPGHTLGQVGVLSPGVLFCADAVVGPEVVDKHGVPLNADIARTLATFDVLDGFGEREAGGAPVHLPAAPSEGASAAMLFVPAHGRPVADIRPVVAANRRRVTATIDLILNLLERPRTAEEVLAAVGQATGLTITNLGQYYLMHLTVMAYLGYLLDGGRITADYEANRQLFCREP